jgi:glycosyltransferase involved in cell wall biosynthesis
VPSPEESPRSNSIAISVVVPVRNEEDSIRALLDGLLRQTLPPDEIVIADGGSTDGTRRIVEDIIRKGSPIKLIVDDDSLPGRARNLAVANARNEWIAFIDAGIKPAPDWLARLAEKAAGDVDVVYGTYDPITDSFFKECAAMAYVPPASATAEGPVRPQSIASALMHREAWRAAGGFPEDLRSAEDLVFMNRVERAGFRIVRAPRALVRWNIQPGFSSTFRRFVVYARHNIRAGLWREWQATIFVRYALLAILMLPAIFLGVRWLFVPLVGWFLLLLLRAIRALWKNRIQSRGLGRRILCLLMLFPIIATLDAAAFVGSLIWLLSDKLGAARGRQLTQ